MRFLRGDDIEEKWNLSLGVGSTGPVDYGQGFLTGSDERYLVVGDGFGADIDKIPPVGTLTLSSVVMACVQWDMRNFTSAPLKIKQKGKDGEIIEDHPLELLVSNPNDEYTGNLLWQMTMRDYMLAGHGYWIQWWNNEYTPLQLWHEPCATIRPYRARGSKNYIDDYELYRNGAWKHIPKGAVVHFRFGDAFSGFSPIEAALREIFIDKEAARYMATMLRNLGVPGAIISAADKDAPIDAAEVKRLYMEKTQGDRRGEPLVWSLPLDTQYPHISPADMGVAQIREEAIMRIPGLLGLNRMVTGLGKDPTFANMKEAREAAFEENLIPVYVDFAAEIARTLLPRTGNPDKEKVIFDITEVSALQEDVDKLAGRMKTLLVDTPIIQVNEARAKLGYEKVDGGDVFLYKQGKDGFYLVDDLNAYLETQGVMKEHEVEQSAQLTETMAVQNQAAQAQLGQGAQAEGDQGEGGGAGTDNVLTYEEAAVA